MVNYFSSTVPIIYTNMSAFDESQDLGQDFVFETDPNSLQRILDNRELSPRSVLAMRMSSKLIQPTLSPAKGAPKQVRDNPEKFDFFESKKGDVFWRPKTPKAKVTSSNTKTQKFGQRQRALGRVAINALPQRQFVNENDPRTTMSSRKPLISNANKNNNKGIETLKVWVISDIENTIASTILIQSS